MKKILILLSLSVAFIGHSVPTGLYIHYTPLSSAAEIQFLQFKSDSTVICGHVDTCLSSIVYDYVFKSIYCQSDTLKYTCIEFLNEAKYLSPEDLCREKEMWLILEKDGTRLSDDFTSNDNSPAKNLKNSQKIHAKFFKSNYAYRKFQNCGDLLYKFVKINNDNDLTKNAIATSIKNYFFGVGINLLCWK